MKKINVTAMNKTRPPGKKNLMIIILALGFLALASGAAYAAMQSIQLNSAASFPVDI